MLHAEREKLERYGRTRRSARGTGYAGPLIPTELIRALMERFSVPGVAVGVLLEDAEEAVGFGVTSLENPLAVDADTLFQIGSITKTFTATAAMRLVAQGQLDFDEPVRTYLPGLRLAHEETASRVTMRHLLSHTGGWVGDYFDPIGHGDDALTLMVSRLDRLEQLTPLGEVWSYNNAGFYIAGRVIEVLTGAPFEAALRDLVLLPLGLEHAFFFAEDAITYRVAVGHDRSGSVARPWGVGRPSAPTGGLVMSARELLRYSRLQFADGKLLSASLLDEMRSPQADVDGTMGADAVGLGWYLFDRDGRSFLTHGGSTNGQQARLIVAPDERFALAILTNHDDGGVVTAEVRDALLESVLGIEPVAEDHLELTADELADYVGAFDAPLARLELDVDGDALVLQVVPKGGFPTPESPPRPAPPPTRLAFRRQDSVVAVEPPLKGAPGDFLRSPTGAIAWFRFGGRLHRPL